MIASSRMRLPPGLVRSLLPGIVFFLGACVACPPIPPLETLPGRDFATPIRAFEYLQDAIVKGEADDSYAYH